MISAMPNIRDVAAAAGTSYATVSRVLNGGPVNEETKERILQAMRDLNYKPNAYARGLGLGRFGVIGVVVPGIVYSYYGQMIEGIGNVLAKAGYEMMLRVTHHQGGAERIVINLLKERRVDGLIIITPREILRSKKEESLLKEVPIIFLDGPSSQKIGSVAGDNLQGGIIVGQHLLALGHRRMAIVLGQTFCSESHERLAGFRQSLREAGLTLDDHFIISSNYMEDGGRTAGQQLLARPDRPTAIFCCNDMMALGVLQTAKALGIRVPEELSIVGYDDASQAQWSNPALTTVRQPCQRMGVVGTEHLLAIIEGNEPPVGERITLPVELVVRESTGQAPAI